MKIFFLGLGLSVLLAACGHVQKEKIKALPTEPGVIAFLNEKLNEAELLLESGEYYDAEKKFREYDTEWTYTIYQLRARIGVARALHGQGRPTLAIPIYNEVIETSVERYPEVTALASFYLSFSHDMLGDEVKTLTALKDAEKLSSYLKSEISLAEIPARLAAYYNRHHDEFMAREYYRSAEQGMSRIYAAGNETAKAEKAKTYLLMGRLNSTQADAESFDRLVGSLSMTQVFLLRSIELNHSKWSEVATKELMQNYSDLWNSILSFTHDTETDFSLAKSQSVEKRITAINLILKDIEILKPYQSVSLANQNTKKIFSFLDQLTQNGQQVILSSAEQSPMTEEAKKRQSLRRDYLIKSEPLFDSEKKPKKSQRTKSTSAADPNIEQVEHK